MEVSAVSMANMASMNGVKSNRVECKPKYNNALQADMVSFTGKKKVDADGNPKKSGFVHKALIAATNCFIPGLGQAINGQWGKAALFAVGAPVATIAAFCVNPALGLAVAAASEIGMFVDAYRNA